MPAQGRELHDLRAVLKRLLERYPKGRGRKALDEDVQRLLGLADEMAALAEPSGRGDDGEESPGERIARLAGRGVLGDGDYQRMAKKLGARDGTGNDTPGRRAAMARPKARHMTTLRDT